MAVTSTYRHHEDNGMDRHTIAPTSTEQQEADWITAFHDATKVRDQAAWALADLILTAREAGLKVTSARMARALDLSAVKIRDQARAAAAFRPETRELNLSYGVHAILAGLPESTRFVTLAQAAAEGWGECSARKVVAAYRQERAGFEDEDRETSQAVIIMRAWNRASPEARQYFAELQAVVGLGLVDEEEACGA